MKTFPIRWSAGLTGIKTIILELYNDQIFRRFFLSIHELIKTQTYILITDFSEWNTLPLVSNI